MRAWASVFSSVLILWAGCDSLLQSREPSGRCGDGEVQSLAGEQCDDGNLSAGDGCSPGCLKEVCGNGIIDTVKGVKEACDRGALNDNGGDCTSACQLARCGDGYVKTRGAPPLEVCDDGNKKNGDGCNPQCALRGQVKILAGEPGGMGVADGVGAAARFAGLHGLASDGKHVYMTDRGACAVRRMDLATGVVETVVGQPGSCLFTRGGVGTGQPGASATFQEIPMAMARVGAHLYLAGSDYLARVAPASGGGLRSDLCHDHSRTFPGAKEELLALAAHPSDTSVLYLSTASLNANGGESSVYQLKLPCTCDHMSSGCKPTLLKTGLGRVSAMAVDPAGGALYLADLSQIVRMDLNAPASPPTLVAGSPTQVGHLDGVGGAARFYAVVSLTPSSSGKELYVVEQSYDKSASAATLSGLQLRRGWGNVRRVALASGAVTTLAGLHGLLPAGASESDGFGAFATFVEPLAATRLGEVLFVGQRSALRAVSLKPPYQVSTAAGGLINDFRYYQVRAVAARAGKIYFSSMAGELVEAPVSSALPRKKIPLEGPCRSPWGITHNLDAITVNGTSLYVADRGLSGICRVDLDGKVGSPCGPGSAYTCSKVFGGGASPTPYSGWLVQGMATDGKVLYLSDARGDGAIIRLDLATGTRLADLKAASALQGPGQLLLHGKHLYVAFPDAHVVLRVDPASGATRTIGSGEAGTRDGSDAKARFCRPVSLASDGIRVFVGEAYCDLDRASAWNGHAVRQVEIKGDVHTVSTLVGPGPEPRVVEAAGTWASLNWPAAMAHDATTGALYVADMWDNVLLKID